MITKEMIEQELFEALDRAEKVVAHMGHHAAAENPLQSFSAQYPERCHQDIANADPQSWNHFSRSYEHLAKQAGNIQLRGFGPAHYERTLQAVRLAAGWVNGVGNYVGCSF